MAVLKTYGTVWACSATSAAAPVPHIDLRQCTIRPQCESQGKSAACTRAHICQRRWARRYFQRVLGIYYNHRRQRQEIKLSSKTPKTTTAYQSPGPPQTLPLPKKQSTNPLQHHLPPISSSLPHFPPRHHHPWKSSESHGRHAPLAPMDPHELRARGFDSKCLRITLHLQRLGISIRKTRGPAQGRQQRARINVLFALPGRAAPRTTER